MEKDNRKTVLVIGAMGGIGESTVNLLVQGGWKVFAADISEKVRAVSDRFDHIIPIEIDITVQASIDAAVRLISGQTSGLDAIIHVAGILKIGSMIEVPVSELKTAFEINLFGIYRVNQSFFPLLNANKGRIVLLSSEVATQTAAPFNGIYSMTKHALEAYADALRRELAFLGIQVIKIQPGPIKSAMTLDAERQFISAESQSQYFKKNISKGIPYLPRVYKNAHEPQVVAKVILTALTAPNPQITYKVKFDTLRMILDRLPVRWADRLIKKILS